MRTIALPSLCQRLKFQYGKIDSERHHKNLIKEIDLLEIKIDLNLK